MKIFGKSEERWVTDVRKYRSSQGIKRIKISDCVCQAKLIDHDRIKDRILYEIDNDICNEIMKATESENVAVYTQATHGCMENRGVESHSSLTQTTVVKGLFNTSHAKTEFFDNIKLQQNFAC